MTGIINFDADHGIDHAGRLAQEFLRTDPLLQYFLSDVADLAWDRYQKHWFITCVFRTPEENAAIAGANPNSAHMDYRAADSRSRHFTQPEIAALLDYYAKRWKPQILFIHHDIGAGAHFHANVNKGFSRKFLLA